MKRARVPITWPCLMCSVLVSSRALADEPSPSLEWRPHWREVGTTEYVVVPSLYAAAFGVYFVIPPEGDADWNKPYLFDNALRDSLRFDSPSGRDRASAASDGLVAASLAYPFVVDAALVSWATRLRAFSRGASANPMSSSST